MPFSRFRFALAFLNTGLVEGNASYVRGNSFHDCFNTGIGVFGTDNLPVEDNVVHHTVGPSIRVAGKDNRILRNLAVYSISIHTYDGRQEKSNIHWPGAIEVHEAIDVILINNTVAGSERFGFKLDGETCTDFGGISTGNEVHGCWHGVHLHYVECLPVCSMLSGFLIWKSYDYGIFTYCSSSIIVDHVIAVDNTVGMFPNVWGPPALSHRTADKYFVLRHSLIVGTSPDYDCAEDGIIPFARRPYGGIGAKKAPGGTVILKFLCFCRSLQKLNLEHVHVFEKGYEAIWAQEQRESFSSQIILCIGFDVHLNSDEISPMVEKNTPLFVSRGTAW